MTRYELADRIGAGGMAEIFRGKAIAAGGFEKPVAIKRILPHLSQDRRFVELLIAEAQILSHLRHRNIVQIFDVGLGDDGQYFLVMEFVDGADVGALQRKLDDKRERMAVDLGLHLGAEVCDALDFAHRATGPDDLPLKLVHRDVSPSNVLISRSGEVKLTDFGIAKRAEEVTGHGTVRGKFAYISPEQARNASVDPRSDVFSVGILMFELLLGTRLFSQMSDFDALRAVREGRVPRPREIEPSLDPELERILLEALAFEPGERFQTAAELGKQLRTFRYSLPSPGGDPAKALADIVDRCTRPEDGARTGARTTSSTFIHLSGDRTAVFQPKSLADARQIVDAFEQDETRSTGKRDQLMAQGARQKAGSGSPEGRTRSMLATRGELAEDDLDVSDEETRVIEDPRLLSADGLDGADGDADDGEDDEETRIVESRSLPMAAFRTAPPGASQPRMTMQGVTAPTAAQLAAASRVSEAGRSASESSRARADDGRGRPGGGHGLPGVSNRPDADSAGGAGRGSGPGNGARPAPPGHAGAGDGPGPSLPPGPPGPGASHPAGPPRPGANIPPGPGASLPPGSPGPGASFPPGPPGPGPFYGRPNTAASYPAMYPGAHAATTQRRRLGIIVLIVIVAALVAVGVAIVMMEDGAVGVDAAPADTAGGAPATAADAGPEAQGPVDGGAQAAPPDAAPAKPKADKPRKKSRRRNKRRNKRRNRRK